MLYAVTREKVLLSGYTYMLMNCLNWIFHYIYVFFLEVGGHRVNDRVVAGGQKGRIGGVYYIC